MMTLLVVDDDVDIRETLVDILQHEGYRVLTAENGRRALTVLVTADPCPQAIIMDLEMPVMSGWEFRNALRVRPEWSQIPVIICSGSVHFYPAHLEPCAAHLMKPVDVSQLLDTVKMCCSSTATVETANKGKPWSALALECETLRCVRPNLGGS